MNITDDQLAKWEAESKLDLETCPFEDIKYRIRMWLLLIKDTREARQRISKLEEAMKNWQCPSCDSHGDITQWALLKEDSE